MVVGALLLFGFVTRAAGGVGVIGELATRPDTAYLTELNAAIPFVVLVGIALAGSLKLLVDPRQVTRFYGLRDARSIRTGMWIAGIGILVVQFSLLPVGLYARFLLDGVTDTDVVVPLLVTESRRVPRARGGLPRGRHPRRGDVLPRQRAPGRGLRGGAGHPHGTRPAPGPGGHRLDALGRHRVRGCRGRGRPRTRRAASSRSTIFSGSLYAVCFLPTVV